MPTTTPEEKTESGLTDQTLEVTPFEDWLKPSTPTTDDGFICQLPSGRVAKVRRTMNLLALLQVGKIPNPLAGIINKMVHTGNADFAGAAKEAEDPEVVRQLFDLMNQTMPQVFIEPRVSAPPAREKSEDWDAYMARIADWEPEEGTLSVHLIDMQDKVYLFAVAQGAAADLSRFREESAAAMESVSASKEVVKPTKRTGGATKAKPRKKS